MVKKIKLILVAVVTPWRPESRRLVAVLADSAMCRFAMLILVNKVRRDLRGAGWTHDPKKGVWTKVREKVLPMDPDVSSSLREDNAIRHLVDSMMESMYANILLDQRRQELANNPIRVGEAHQAMKKARGSYSERELKRFASYATSP